jgi:hypothetical protein
MTSMFEYLCINWKGGNGGYQWIQEFGESKFLLLIEWNLLVQAPHQEESKEYFILPKNPDCNEDGRLKNNTKD